MDATSLFSQKSMSDLLEWFVHSSPSEGRRQWQEQQRKKNLLRLFGIGALLILFIAVGAAFAFQQIKREASFEAAGNTIVVRRGGNFQAALNQARAGDTIVLEAGAQFVGSFELPNKQGAEYITIQSSQVSKLPENVRVQPKDSYLMPKILSPGKGVSAVSTAPSSHHYRFIGIEFGVATEDYVYNLISLGTDDQKAEEMPRFFEFDRCYLRTRGLNKIRRGFALNNADTVIKNSYLAGFAGAQDETQAIAGWNGAGRYKILNNHLEGGGENILFGGGDPSIKNLVPSDIEIRGNLFTKPEEWRGKVTIKNTLELKNARRVVITGNILENGWDSPAFVLTVRNQNGTAPWSTIEDVEIRDNLIRNVGAGISILGLDDAYPSQKMKRVKIANNLFDEMKGWESYFLKIADGEDIEVSHNTVFHEGNMMTIHGSPSRRFKFNYNILAFNDYGVFGDGVGAASNFAKFFPDGIIIGNIVTNEKNVPENEFTFTPRNFLAPNFNAVDFVNKTGGDYRLASSSRFKGKAEDGTDIGANIERLNTAINGVKTSAKTP